MNRKTRRPSLRLVMCAFTAALACAASSSSAQTQAPTPPSSSSPAPKKPKPERVLDPDLIFHVGVSAGRLRAGGFTDETGKVKGVIVGNPMKTTLGPSEGFKFNGSTDWLLIADDVTASRAGLPARDMTISTWVSIPAAGDSGTIIGARQGDSGWSLGFANNAFEYALSSAKPTSAAASTTIKSTTQIVPGRWYFVVATYDGRSMKLFVNGEPQGDSKEQAGDIAYSKSSPYAIGCHWVQNQPKPARMTMLEARVIGRPLTPQQITEEFVPGVRLSSFQPELEATQRFVVKSFLQFATMESVTIVWETSRPGRGVVEYGTKLPYDQRAEAGGGSEGTAESLIHRVELTGLKPQTPYFYRVRTINPDGSELVGEDLTFQTAVLPDTPYAFSIIGDTQKNKPVIEKLQAFAYTMRPNFQIHLGDVVDKGADKSEWTEELLAGSWPLMSRVAMFPCIGNHEENHSNYYQYFALPAPQCWYTFTYGNAQFFSIDTNKAVDPESEQYKWLDRELGASKATWKFVYHHHPVYSSDEDDYGNTYKGPSEMGDPRIRPLASLFEKHRVDIDFNGHIHCYERSWPIYQGKVDQARGVRYITSGGGGGGLESAAPSRTWFAQRVYRGHHVCQIMIHDKTLQMQVFDLEGRLIDSMDIRKQ